MVLSLFKRIYILLIMCLLFSCNQDSYYSDNMIEFNRQENISTHIEVNDPNEILELINNSNNVLLYIFSSTCSSCKEYEPIINNFIADNKIIMYSINSNKFPNLSRIDYFSHVVTPTICLYSNRTTIFKINPSTDPKYFASSKMMNQIIEDYGFLSKKIKIKDEIDLTNIINKQEDKIIYYNYPKCSDCTYLDYNYLNKELRNKYIKEFYYFDMSYYYENRTSSEDKIFKDFTDKYKLSNITNLGYKNGVVPTFQIYNNNELIKNIIIFNDEFEVNKNNQEIVSVKLISSFYQDNPFINEIFYQDDNSSAMNNYRKKTLSFYVNKIKTYLF